MPLTPTPRFADYLLKSGLTPAQLPDLLHPKPPASDQAAALLASLSQPGRGEAIPPVTGQTPQQQLLAAGQQQAIAGVPIRNDPVGRFEAQAEQLRSGTHDPSVIGEEQFRRAIATGLELPLMAADVPRQAVVASGGEGFVNTLTANGDWGAIYLIMSNLGAANKSNPLAQRSPQEQAILPEQFGSDIVDTRSIDQRQKEYAAYMSSLPPDQQAAVMQQFNQWMDQKRDQFYTPGREDLKVAVSFEQWQALNYDKALAAFNQGWQKASTPVMGPDGRPVPMQPENENPVFAGGQAVWEAYVNELDPAQRAIVDIAHDPTVGISLLTGGAKLGAQAVTKAVPEAAAVSKAMQGAAAFGDVLGEAGNANVLGLLTGVASGGAPAAARYAGRKIAPTALGRVAAGAGERLGTSGLGRFTARAVAAGRTPFQEPAAMRERFRPFWEGIMEQHTLTEEQNKARFQAGATTPPAGAAATPNGVTPFTPPQPGPTTPFGVTPVDMTQVMANREGQRRAVPPRPTVALHRWGKAPEDPTVSAFYVDPKTRAVERPTVGADGITRDAFSAEEWDKTTGSWVPVTAEIPVEGTMTRERAKRGVLAELTRIADEKSTAEFTEIGMPLEPGEVSIEWTGPEIKQFFDDHMDAEMRGLYESNPAAEEKLRELSAEIMAQVPTDVLPPHGGDPSFNNLELLGDAGVRVPLVLRGDDFDTLTQLHNDLGSTPPSPQTIIPTSQLPSPASNVPPIPPRLAAPAIPLGPPRQVLPEPEPPTPAPRFEQQRTIDISTLTSPPAAQTVRDLGVPTGAPPPRDQSFGMHPLPEQQITPVSVDIGREKGTGLNGTAIGVINESGDEDLKTAIGGFQSIGKGGNKATYRGELTVDQARTARDLLAQWIEDNPRGGYRDKRDSLRQAIARLDAAISGAPETSPGTMPPAPTPPTLPPLLTQQLDRGRPPAPPISDQLQVPSPVQRHVRLQSGVRDFLIKVADNHPEMISDDLRTRLESAPRLGAQKRGLGARVEVILSDADADQIRGVRAALESKQIKIGQTIPTSWKRDLAKFDDTFSKSLPAGPRTPLTDADKPQPPPLPAQESLDFDRNAPDLGVEGERVTNARRAAAAAGQAPPIFTKGAPTQPMGFKPDPIEQQLPPDRSVPLGVGVRDELGQQRQSLAPSPEELPRVLAPFGDSINQAIAGSGAADKAGLTTRVQNLLRSVVQKHAAEFRSADVREGGSRHEIESALAIAQDVVNSLDMINQADPSGAWREAMPEIAYGSSRPELGIKAGPIWDSRTGMKGQPHGDFDAVLHAIFGSSRKSKVTSKGAQSYASSGTEQIVTKLAQNSDPSAQRLLSEIDLYRRRYIDLIGGQGEGGRYYAGAPVNPQRVDTILGGLKDAAMGLKDYVVNTPQGPEVTPRFVPSDKTPFELMSAKGQAALSEEWTNHPTMKGMTGEQVYQDVHNKAVSEIGEYQRLLRANGPVPPGRKVCRPGGGCKMEWVPPLSDDHKRMDELKEWYKWALPQGMTLENADHRVVAVNQTLREFLYEIGEIQPGDNAENWAINIARWTKGLYQDLGSASAQVVLHSPTNFRYMGMNWLSNPVLMFLKYPRTAMRMVASGEFQAGYARGTKGTASPIRSAMEAVGMPGVEDDYLTQGERSGIRWLTGVNREAAISEKFAQEKAQRGVRELLNRLGGQRIRGPKGKTLSDLAFWYERGAKVHIATESEQRISGWESRAKERVMESWMAYQGAIHDAVAAKGVDLDMAALRKQLPLDPGGFEVYDRVYRMGIQQGADETTARSAAQAAYDKWRNPLVRAVNEEAINDIKGPMPLNRKTPLDTAFGFAVPFSFWNSRISKFLLGQMYSSPMRMAAMQRYEQWADQYERDHPDMPPYLHGLVQLGKTPFGAILAANPAAFLFTAAFTSDHATKDGVDQTMWDEIWGTLGDTFGFAAQPPLRFMANLTGLSHDRNVTAPLVLPTDIRLIGALIDAAGMMTVGQPGVPVWKDAWTWAANTGNGLLRGFIPGMETTSLRDPNVKLQDPIQAMIVQNHPELVQAIDDAEMGSPERDAALDAYHEAVSNENGDLYREAAEQVAMQGLFTASFNTVMPVYASSYQPGKGMLGAATENEANISTALDESVAAAEEAALVSETGVSGATPAGGSEALSATAPQGVFPATGGELTQPLGTTDWEHDPRWANHLTGGPAPDAQEVARRESIFLTTDAIGATPEFAAILQDESHYHNIGTALETQAYNDWYAIAYGQPMRTVDMGAGGKFSPTDVTAMTAEQRQTLANEWAMSHAAWDGTPIVPLIESYRTKKDAFAASHPQWGAYDQWRDNVRQEVENGLYPSVEAWAQTQASANPQFRRIYDDTQFRVDSGEYDADAAESRYLSVGGYLAYQGQQKSTTDPMVAAPPLLSGGVAGVGAGATQDQIFQAVQAATNSGAAYNPAEAIRQDIASYSSDEMLTNSFLQRMGMRTPWGRMMPREQEMWTPLLEQYGLPTPRLSDEATAYVSWASEQQPGADVSAEAFLSARQQSLLTVLGGGQGFGAQTPGTAQLAQVSP